MIVGYYLNCDDVVCVDSRSRDEWEGFEEWDEPLPIFSHTESDSPTHCGVCEILLRHNLRPTAIPT